MKNTFLIAIMLVSTLTFAQSGSGKTTKNDGMNQKESFTPEQKAELQTKRMTLVLDLTAKQQEEIKKVVLENAKKREAKKAEMISKKEGGEKPSSDERFKMQSQNLDDQIAMKSELKKILTKEQMEKFEAQQKAFKEKRNNKSEKRNQKK